MLKKIVSYSKKIHCKVYLEHKNVFLSNEEKKYHLHLLY